MDSVNHLIECRCILPQYKKAIDPPFHKFVVFSVIDKFDVVLEKACCGNIVAEIKSKTRVFFSVISIPD